MKTNTFFIIFVIAIFSNKLISQIQVGQDIYGKAAGDNAGEAVAISADGEQVIIGSRWNKDNGGGSNGHARVYEYNNGVWNQLGEDIYGDQSISWFGVSVAISNDGSIIAVGGSDVEFSDDPGHVKLFQYINNHWVQLGNTIYGNENGDIFGASISLSSNGTRVAVGSPGNQTGAWRGGRISVFELKNEIWTEIGQTFYGSYSHEQMGHSLTLSPDGNRLAIKRQNGGNNNGVNVRKVVEIREYDGNNWSLIGEPIQGSLASFGNFISLSNDGSIVALSIDGVFDSAYVFELNGSQWNLKGNGIKKEYNTSNISSLTLSGDGMTLAIGDDQNDDYGFTSGQARVFKFDNKNSNDWVQLGIDIGGSPSDRFGKGLSLSNNATRLVAGAKFADGGGLINNGRARVYDLNFNTVEGNILFDVNQDGCDNSGSPIINSKLVLKNNSNEIITFSDNNGKFYFSTKEGIFNISSKNSLFVTNPIASEVVFDELGDTKQISLCASANGNISDVVITIIPTSVARPGFETNYRLVYENLGNSIVNGNISFQFNSDKQSYVSSSQIFDSQTSNSIGFLYTDLLPFEKRNINIKLSTDVPPNVNGGDILLFESSIISDEMDGNLNNNNFTFNQVVVNSFDPNDKQVLQGNQITIDKVDNYLNYVVRFQNTGTASAVNVRIRDILESELDWSTFAPIDASHPYNIQITEGNLVDFMFNNIELPAEQDDEPMSHGFVAFKIKPKVGVSIGDIITGKANIYFDFNAPIVTNTVSTEITSSLSTHKNLISNFNIYPNPTKSVLNIQSKTQMTKLEIYNNLGQIVFSELDKTAIDISTLKTGIYFIKIKDVQGNSEIKKMIKK